MRHEFYIGERGWKALNSLNGREFDQFDDERALYFIAFDEADSPICSARLRPTDDKSLLRDLFPHLAAPSENPSYGADVWELTRFLVADGWRGGQGRGNPPYQSGV
jgi:acyl-homoserine lactone synthase